MNKPSFFNPRGQPTGEIVRAIFGTCLLLAGAYGLFVGFVLLSISGFWVWLFTEAIPKLIGIAFILAMLWGFFLSFIRIGRAFVR